MKRLLTVLLAAIALPVFGAGGWTVIGHPVSVYNGPDPELVVLGLTNTVTNWVEAVFAGPGSANPLQYWTGLTNYGTFTNGLVIPPDPNETGLNLYYVSMRSSNSTDWVTLSTNVWGFSSEPTNAPGLYSYKDTSIFGGQYYYTVRLDSQYSTTNPLVQDYFPAVGYYNTNCFGCQAVSTNPGAFNWAKQLKDTGGNTLIPYKIACDTNGNSYVVGKFSSSADLGDGVTRTANGDYDCFLVKYSSAGRVLWASNWGPSEVLSGKYALGRAVAVDNSGNVIVAGVYLGATDFGGVTLTGSVPCNFISKYSTDGILLWATNFSGGQSSVYDIVVDPSDNLLMTGHMTDSINAAGVALTRIGTSVNVITVKLSGINGSAMWAHNYSGLNNKACFGDAVAVDSSGNMIVVGEYGFLATSPGGIDLGSGQAGTSGIFIAKYSSSSGAYVWSHLFEGAKCGQVSFGFPFNDVAVDPSSGCIFVSCSAPNGVNFGGGSLNNPNSGSGGFAVVGFNSSGTWLWNKMYGQSANDSCAGMAVSPILNGDGSRNLAIAGNNGGNPYWDSIVSWAFSYLANLKVTSTNCLGVQWVTNTATYTTPQSLAQDYNGHVLIVGYLTFNAPITWPSGLIFTSVGIVDGYNSQFNW